MNNIALSINGRPCKALPDCAGLYRFFASNDTLLYVGKSLHIRKRVNSHFSSNGKTSARQQRMLTSIARIDCQPTAGELGALLMENQAIKNESPLYNRRQRELRRLWTLMAQPSATGFLQPQASAFLPEQCSSRDLYGLYPSRHACTTMLRALTREQGLCPIMLGLERGRGPCFLHQIGRCRGACCGRESADQHNARLLEYLAAQRILAWPFAGPVRMGERCASPCQGQPDTQWHHVSYWAYLGTTTTANGTLNRRSAFDRDAYRILLRALQQGGLDVIDAQGEANASVLAPFTAQQA